MKSTTYLLINALLINSTNSRSLPARSSEASTELDARALVGAIVPVNYINTRISCGCGFPLNRKDTNLNVEGLEKYYSQRLPGGTDDLGIIIEPNSGSGQDYQRSVAVFVQNECEDQWVAIYPGEIAEYLGEITGACGKYIAGTMQKVRDNPCLTIGYMQKNLQWREHMWVSNEHHC